SSSSNATSTILVSATASGNATATSSAGISITFPTASQSVSFTTAVIPSSVTTTTVVSIPANFSFLTESTLIFTSVPTSSPSLTNPDEPTLTPTFSSQAASASAPVSTPALPANLPTRISPPQPLDFNQNLEGYSLISILFNQQLNWKFVTENQAASSQIIVFMPAILQSALNLTADQVKTWVLQVYEPSSYNSTQDADQLGTTFLAYVPTNVTDTLRDEMKVKTSAFYSSTDPRASGLADRVVLGYDIFSVTPPSEDDTSDSAKNDQQSDTSGSSKSSRTRQDAIIGVTVSLGAIAIIVLAYLVYRAWKRRQETLHKRLSDAQDPGLRQAGRDFDQDSVGGQRRRSFYFAQDSLRDSVIQTQAMTQAQTSQVQTQAPGLGYGYAGYTSARGGQQQELQQQQQVQQNPAALTPNRYEPSRSNSNRMAQMAHRKPVPNISAPILQQSSMNW
ncbi:hypothetical protein K435DRAFT_669818, partial [Dendrothele bispora CBS 962.96]